MRFSHMSILNPEATEFKSAKNHLRTSPDLSKINQQNHTLLELIKKQCNSSDSLKKKLIEWAGSQPPKSSTVSQENVLKLSQGRLWVSARSLRSEGTDDESVDNSLGDLKGAYQECESGVYEQPIPHSRFRRGHHRLLRGSFGLWVLEIYDVEKKVWNVRAQQTPDGL